MRNLLRCCAALRHVSLGSVRLCFGRAHTPRWADSLSRLRSLSTLLPALPSSVLSSSSGCILGMMA